MPSTPVFSLLTFLFYLHTTHAQFSKPVSDTVIAGDSKHINGSNKRLNFFIVSRPKKLLDPASRFNIVRAKLKSLLRHKRFVCIVASSTKQMADKIEYRLKKYQCIIGSLWFDSHGSYKKGYSFFTVGHDEFSYKNIRDTTQIEAFNKLAGYCDSDTKIGIGSCYGGATYARPESETFKESKMNGDSLMIGLANIFPAATVYACESWVMTKPGLFKERFAMAGAPLRKKFKDTVFAPVWERLGMWNCYNASSNDFKGVNCVILTKYGDIKTRFNNYQSLKKVTRKIACTRRKLKPNYLKV